MGYSHSWSQLRDLTTDEWQAVRADIGEILKYVQHTAGIPLGDGSGDPGTSPEILRHYIGFNGLGKDHYETFSIHRVRDPDSWDFCKTEHKPYDIAVVAVLCYLDTCLETPAFHIQSDGRGHEWTDGLDLARKALPSKANILDLPMGVMQRDRWTGPWINDYQGESGYEVNFCVNGKGYVMRRDGKAYCFASHVELATFLDATKVATFRKGGTARFGSHAWPYDKVESNIWNATGSFDEARHNRIKRAQAKVLKTLFPVPPEHDEPPPSHVRPMDFPRPEQNGTFCHYLEDLLKLHGDAA